MVIKAGPVPSILDRTHETVCQRRWGEFCGWVGYSYSMSCSQRLFPYTLFATVFPTSVGTVNMVLQRPSYRFYHFGGHFLIGHRYPSPPPLFPVPVDLKCFLSSFLSVYSGLTIVHFTIIIFGMEVKFSHNWSCFLAEKDWFSARQQWTQ